METYEGCVNIVEESWPVAYAECAESQEPRIIRLREHLAKTAKLLQRLFDARLRILEPVYRKLRAPGSVADIAYTVALLHDYGKLSDYYLRMFKSNVARKRSGELRVTYPYHEHVGALVVARVSAQLEQSGDVEKALAYTLVSMVISRHHAAMPERHPAEVFKEYTGGGTPREIIDNAVSGLCKSDTYIQLAQSLSEECRSCDNCEICQEVIRETINILEQDCEGGHTRNYLLYGSRLVTVPRENVPESSLIRVITSLTGFLVIADNLVASCCESRSDDDETLPAYVEHWKRELKARLFELALKEPQIWGKCIWF